VRIFIGEELSLPELAGLSLVTATYRREGQVAGVLGVIGPTRMAYERIIPIVACAAESLSQRLSLSENGLPPLVPLKRRREKKEREPAPEPIPRDASEKRRRRREGERRLGKRRAQTGC
jgi:hypothetical protein